MRDETFGHLHNGSYLGAQRCTRKCPCSGPPPLAPYERFRIDLAQPVGVPSRGRYLNLALLWFVYSITGSPVKTTIIGLLHTIPPIVLGPFIGVYVDRLPKKFFLIGANVFRAVLIGIIPCAVQPTPSPSIFCISLSSSTRWRWRRSVRR